MRHTVCQYLKMQLEHPNLGGECAQCPTGSAVPVLKSYLYFTKSYLNLTILIIPHSYLVLKVILNLVLLSWAPH